MLELTSVGDGAVKARLSLCELEHQSTVFFFSRFLFFGRSRDICRVSDQIMRRGEP